MIYGLILGFHLLICLTLILTVLMQSGKGGGLAGAFGGAGGAGQTLFGGRGAATFLSKATTVLGITFMSTSLLLALMAGNQGTPRSVLRDAQNAPGTQPPPASSQPIQIPGGTEAFTLPTESEGGDALTPGSDQPLDLSIPAAGEEPASPADEEGTPAEGKTTGDN